ncbi:hypothetical protein [Streptomyces sp. NPDC017230]|uniref:hypothetical protein n=1 Tax=unclassified Streptomyces TaxID=2593676 RepID=UPI0037BA2F76
MNIEAILVGLLSVAHTPEQAEHAAKTVLRDHAHQLAETIRNSKELRDYTDDHMGDCNMAADLIDPGAQR